MREAFAAAVPDLMPALKAALLEEGFSAPKPKLPGEGAGTRRCPFCKRPNCPMLDDGTRLCKAASDALSAQRLKAKEEDKKE